MTEQSELLRAVKNLGVNVKALDDTIKKEYPKRDEVQRDYVTKVEGKKRLQYFALVALASTILSFFVTVSSVNYCFLNGIPAPGERDICQAFPGWEESFDNNRDSLKVVVENQQRLEELERKVGIKP